MTQDPATGEPAAPSAWWEPVLDWLASPVVFWTMFGTGVGTVLLAIVFLPLLVARLPADRFAISTAARARQRSLLGWLWLVLRNTFGTVLVIVGLILLLLPGQGLLMILVGLLIMDFPGKHALERRIVRRPAILRAINGMREKRGRPPFVFD